MVSYSKRLVACQLHISRDYVYRFLTVAVGERVFDGVIGNSLPNTVFLYVSHLGSVEIHLAEIVQERRDSKGLVRKLKSVFFLKARTVDKVTQTFVNVQTVLKKTTLVSAVKACAGRGCKEVAFVG